MQTTADNSTSAYGVYIILCSYPPYVSTEGYISCWFFLCPVTDISATVTPIGVKFFKMVHIGPG